MRLIDADVLRESFDSNTWQGEMLIAVVDAQPTIEAAPVVHGEWEKTSEYMPIYGCSICKERNLFKNGDNVFSNFCPNCGARMDGKAVYSVK